MHQHNDHSHFWAGGIVLGLEWRIWRLAGCLLVLISELLSPSRELVRLFSADVSGVKCREPDRKWADWISHDFSSKAGDNNRVLPSGASRSRRSCMAGMALDGPMVAPPSVRNLKKIDSRSLSQTAKQSGGEVAHSTAR